MAQDVGASGSGASGGVVTQGDAADEVHEAAKVYGVQVAPGVDFGEYVPKYGVVLFDGVHGGVDFRPDARLFGMGLDVVPAGGFGDKKDVLRLVLVPVFGVGVLVFTFAIIYLRI
jgi:hypothetical protein